MTAVRSRDHASIKVFSSLLLGVFVIASLSSQTQLLTALRQSTSRLSLDTNVIRHDQASYAIGASGETSHPSSRRWMAPENAEGESTGTAGGQTHSGLPQGDESSRKHENSYQTQGQEESDLQLVACTRVRNEAPYLIEWIEYHRMIGFEAFLLMNDNSTDDTQCILDAYAKEGLVIRMPQDYEESRHDLQTNIDNVFDACTRYLNSHQYRFDPSQTWMMTHDTDEFVWFDQTENTPSLGSTLSNLIQKYGSFIKSLRVPRFAVGSSGKENYEEGLVIDRFTKRFDLESCPKERNVQSDDSPEVATSRLRAFDRKGYQRQGVFDQQNPISYCNYKRRTTFKMAKSISLVSTIAEYCKRPRGRKNGKTVIARCSTTHHHTLKDPGQPTTNATLLHTTSTVTSRAVGDKRYLQVGAVVPSIVILHFKTKSRQEFYSRVCDSAWLDKYTECERCSPETFFDRAQTYANNKEDTRMAPFASKLRPILESSTVGKSCNTEPVQHSLDYYQECLESGTRLSLPKEAIR